MKNILLALILWSAAFYTALAANAGAGQSLQSRRGSQADLLAPSLEMTTLPQTVQAESAPVLSAPAVAKKAEAPTLREMKQEVKAKVQKSKEKVTNFVKAKMKPGSISLPVFLIAVGAAVLILVLSLIIISTARIPIAIAAACVAIAIVVLILTKKIKIGREG